MFSRCCRELSFSSGVSRAMDRAPDAKVSAVGGETRRTSWAKSSVKRTSRRGLAVTSAAQRETLSFHRPSTLW